MDTKKPTGSTRVELNIDRTLTDKEAYHLEMDLWEFMKKRGMSAAVDVNHRYKECPACKYGDVNHLKHKTKMGIYTGEDGEHFHCGGG